MQRIIRVLQLNRSLAVSSNLTQTNHNYHRNYHKKHQTRKIGKLALISGVAISGAAIIHVKKDEEDSPQKVFSLMELAEMCAKGRIVVAYQGSLYDMTHFTGHPGGVGRLQMASGNDLEVYWTVYTQHNRGHIMEHMKRYKIGEVSKEDMKLITQNTVYDSSVYSDNPEPYPNLLTNTRYPYNAEGRLDSLTDSWVTPAGKHFVRNHCAVPDIDPEQYTLTITGEGLTETVLTLEDLKTKFEKVDITTVIQCNGNRREDFHYLDGKTPAFGPPHWVAGAIGNSTWSGPRLRDVLREAGMDVDNISLGKIPPPSKALWCGLLGYDHDEVGNQYCCSFPFDKAIDPFGDVILAYEMNGQPIPRSHGFPVRAIVPGHAGARFCKFLEKVSITDVACKDDANWKQYAVHAPDVPVQKIAEFNLNKEELVRDPPVQEMPVQSMITNPSPHEIVAAVQSGCRSIRVKGIAWGGGGLGVARVDVSVDNGENFTRADLIKKPITEKRKSQWSWQFFEKNVPLPDNIREKLLAGENVDIVLTSKAFNSAWNVQPENPNYNAHGCCVNHWYRIPITLNPNIEENEKSTDNEYANKPSGGYFTKPFRHFDSPYDSKKTKQ